VPPCLELPGYAAGLEAAWVTEQPGDASGEEPGLLRPDPGLLIDHLTRQDGTMTLAQGRTAQRRRFRDLLAA